MRTAAGGGLSAAARASWDAALEELRSAADADPSALADERQLRALVAPISGGASDVAGGGAGAGAAALPALKALSWLLVTASEARALHVARTDGVAAALEAGLRSLEVNVAAAASEAIVLALRHKPAAHVFLDGVPGLVALAAARLAACAPRAAALAAGVDAAAAGFVGSASGFGKANQRLCENLISALLCLINHTTMFSRAAADLVAPTAPALVAALALPDARSAWALAAAAAVRTPEAGLRLFKLGGRGVLRSVDIQLLRLERELEGGAGAVPALEDARLSTWNAAVVDDAACKAVVSRKPRLLAAPEAEPWAAAAPRLGARLLAVQRLLEPAAAAEAAAAAAEAAAAGEDGGNADDDGDRRGSNSSDATIKLVATVKTSKAGLDLLAAWVPRARRVAEAAAQRQDSDGGGTPAQRRCCAACGRTRADGARLHRCRGCGPLTGVMYCSAACAREHWVRRGHRKVCEPASAQLKQLQQEADEVHGQELIAVYRKFGRSFTRELMAAHYPGAA